MHDSNPIHQRLVLRGENLRSEISREIDAGGEPRVALSKLRSIRPLFEPRTVKGVRESAAGTLAILRNDGAAESVTTCREADLDSDLRYIGAANGVIDLHTGKRLSPEEGRLHYVTKRTPVVFREGATHPDVDRLFAHLALDEQEWWWEVLGYALLGSPSARIYEVIGPPAGGKSGLIAALRATLGPYASIPQAGLLEQRRGAVESETGLSPGTYAVVPPRRLALFDEVKPSRLNNKLMKDWSGDGGGVTWQPKYKDPRTDPVSATMFLFCNTGSEARLGMRDPGMRRRLRSLRYPAIPRESVVDDFNTVRIHDPAVQEALLARLVAEAAKAKPGAPPAAPISVKQTTTMRIVDELGEIGRFAQRLQRGSGSLTFEEVWAAWCEHNDEPVSDKTAPGGIPLLRLTRELRILVPTLPAPKKISLQGKKVRAWTGWKLVSAEEAEDEMQTVPDRFDLNAAFEEIAADLNLKPDKRHKAEKWAEWARSGATDRRVSRSAAEKLIETIGDPPEGAPDDMLTADMFAGMNGNSSGEPDR